MEPAVERGGNGRRGVSMGTHFPFSQFIRMLTSSNLLFPVMMMAALGVISGIL